LPPGCDRLDQLPCQREGKGARDEGRGARDQG
jgi:hypothetical protein